MKLKQITNRLNNILEDRIIRKQLQYSFLFVFLLLFIAHAARYFNLAYTNDSVQINQATDANWQFHLGRWGQVLYCRIRGTIVAPYVIGLLSGLYISAAVFLLLRMFCIENKVHMLILSMFMTCNEALNSLNATFINSSDIILFSMFLSVLAVFCWNKWRYGFLLSIPFLTLSFSMYQADIQTAILLIIILLLIRLLSSGIEKSIVIQGIKAILFVGAATILYMLSAQIVSEHTQNTLSMGHNSPGLLFTESFFSDLLSHIPKAWLQPFEFMLSPHTLHPKGTAVCYMLLVLWTVFLVGNAIRKAKVSFPTKCMAIMLLIVMPLGMNFSGFLTGLVRERMTYAYSLSILLLIILFERKMQVSQRKSPNKLMHQAALVTLSGLLFFNNLVYGNEYYIRRKLEESSTLSLITRILDRIEQTPGYTRETSVDLIGTLYDSPLAMTRSGFEHLGERDDPNTSNVFMTTTPEKYYWYFWQVLGYPLNLVDEHTHSKISARRDVRAMPVFPSEGCIQFVDDILVVKVGAVFIPPEN